MKPYAISVKSSSDWDASYLAANSKRPAAAGDGITNFQTTDPPATGQNPLAAWGGVVEQINAKLVASYTLIDPLAGTTIYPGGIGPSGPIACPQLPATVFTKGIWSLMDIVRARNTLRSINAAVVLPQISNVWTVELLQKLLTQRWTKCGPVDSDFDVEACPAFSADSWVYQFDLKDGLGPRTMYYPILLKPVPALQLLAQWSMEDTFKGATPKIRGSVIVDASAEIPMKFPEGVTWTPGTYTVTDGQGTVMTAACMYPDKRPGAGHGNLLVQDYFIVTAVTYLKYDPLAIDPPVMVNSSTPGQTGQIAGVAGVYHRFIFNSLKGSVNQAKELAALIEQNPPASGFGAVGQQAPNYTAYLSSSSIADRTCLPPSALPALDR